MAGMTDLTLVGKIMQALWSSSTTFTITPGTSGGSAFTITPPLRLHLFTAVGTEAASGTEMTTEFGYTSGYPAGGGTLGSSAFGAPASGVQTNNNAVSWSATGTWPTITSIEIWDSLAATGTRNLWGNLTSSITGAANGDTVQFAAASISISGALW
jgi:hypothetical protein